MSYGGIQFCECSGRRRGDSRKGGKGRAGLDRGESLTSRHFLKRLLSDESIAQGESSRCEGKKMLAEGREKVGF